MTELEHTGRSYRVKCPECGKTIGIGDRYCRGCGENLNDDSEK